MNNLTESFIASGLRNERLYYDIVEYLSSHEEATTPSAITIEIKKHYDKLSHNTVRKYLDSMINDEVIIAHNRRYIKSISGKQDKLLGYNKVFMVNPKYVSGSVCGAARKQWRRYALKVEISKILEGKGFSLETGVVNIYGKDKERRSYMMTVDITFVAEKDDEKFYVAVVDNIKDADLIFRAYLLIKDNFPKHIVFTGEDFKKYGSGIVSEKYADFVKHI